MLPIMHQLCALFLLQAKASICKCLDMQDKKVFTIVQVIVISQYEWDILVISSVRGKYEDEG